MAKKKCGHGYELSEGDRCVKKKTKVVKAGMTGTEKGTVAARVAAAMLSVGLSEAAFAFAKSQKNKGKPKKKKKYSSPSSHQKYLDTKKKYSGKK